MKQKYQVMIDNLTFEKLLEMGLLDEYNEDIYVRKVGEERWQVARKYPFSFSDSLQSAIIDEPALNKKEEPVVVEEEKGIDIDEYGQVTLSRSSVPPAESGDVTSSETRRGIIISLIILCVSFLMVLAIEINE